MRNVFGDGKYVFAGEKTNSRGKRGKYVEKENMFLRKRRTTEKEKEDYLHEAGPSR